ncbi:conserved hypothetical protein [Methylocella tundrae]|uniref:DUF4089 domain-containing protein n=1 Tax=Methylocella tundrae TaxID=227605 RepID=A0A8B6MCR1_METTU|nr:DUF4089 domain-containing protein [Methylocella tundrae]VTZ52445.1 conserved hypothetical protein [Methylocella tundrae]
MRSPLSESELFDPDALVTAMAPLLGFGAIEDYRAGIVANLKLTVALAELVISFPLDDHEEPAEVFRA